MVIKVFKRTGRVIQEENVKKIYETEKRIVVRTYDGNAVQFYKEADMNLYEIYYINRWKPHLNVDDKARDNLSISLTDKEWIEFIPTNWDDWKKEISTDNSGVALWHRLRNEKALRGEDYYK